MSCWETLDLEPGSSRKDIKRAYGKLIRQYRPDEAPEQFREIRDAYEQAISTLEQGGASVGVSPQLSMPQRSIKQQEPLLPLPDRVEGEQVEKTSEQNSVQMDPAEYQAFIDSFTEMRDELLADEKPSSEALMKCREKVIGLLGQSVAHNLDVREYLSSDVFNLLLERVDIAPGFLSTEINYPAPMLRCLDDHFLWHMEELDFSERFDQESSDLLYHGINEARKDGVISWSDSNFDTVKGNQPKSSKGIKQGIRSVCGALVAGCYAFIPFAILLAVLSAYFYGTSFRSTMIIWIFAILMSLRSIYDGVGWKIFYERYAGIATAGLAIVVPLYLVVTGFGFADPGAAATLLMMPPCAHILYIFIVSK